MSDDDLQQHAARAATTRWLAVGLALALLSPALVLMGCDRGPGPGTPAPRTEAVRAGNAVKAVKAAKAAEPVIPQPVAQRAAYATPAR